jgi:hypothetical protein
VGLSEERAARNEAVFRDANERIAERREALAAVEGRTPFLCECEDERCTEVVLLTRVEYERVRAEATRFVVVPGHPTHGKEDGFSGDGWISVRKTGRGAEIARESAEH